MNDPESERNSPERKSFWKDEILNKSPDQIAAILVDFEKRATRDHLTGLINEEEFYREFNGFSTGAIRRDSQVMIVIFDFDDLKKTNDTISYAAGDELLKKGSNLLRFAIRSSDLFARLHGDEFVAAMEFERSLNGTDYAESSIQRVVNILEKNKISVSIGLSDYKEGDVLSQVIEKAEFKMKKDKETRKAGRDFNK